MAASKVDAAPKLAEVEKENAELKAKIAALKNKLGITAQEEKEERARIKATFALFDRDNDGFIDKTEFELLAFECGTDVAALTPDNVAKSINAINPKGDGKISFEDFLAWQKSDKGIKASKGAQLGVLRMKLQSKAWMARLNEIRAKYGKKPDAKDAKSAKDDKKDSKSSSSSSSSSSASSSKDAKDAKDTKESAKDAKDAKESKLLNVSLGVGSFADAKAGIYLDLGEDATLAKSTRTAVNCPDGVNFFAHIDLAIKDGADEAKVAELLGVFDTILQAVPWQQLPMQIYNSHTADMVEVSGKKYVRITIFSSFDPEEMAAQMLQTSDLKASQVASGSVKLEFPFSVENMTEPQFRLTPDNMKARLAVALDVNRKLKDVAQGVLAGMPAEARLAILGFFVKGIDIDVKFANLSDFLKAVPEAAPAGQGQHRRKSPAEELKAAIAGVGEYPIADMIPGVMGALPALAASAGQDALYDQVRGTLLGLRRIHVQMHDFVARLELKGVDVFPLFPPAN